HWGAFFMPRENHRDTCRIKRIAAKSSAMKQQIRLAFVVVGLAFSVAVIAAPTADNADAAPKKTRTDPCIDLKPDKSKTGEKKPMGPSAKPAEPGKRQP